MKMASFSFLNTLYGLQIYYQWFKCSCHFLLAEKLTFMLSTRNPEFENVKKWRILHIFITTVHAV